MRMRRRGDVDFEPSEFKMGQFKPDDPPNSSAPVPPTDFSSVYTYLPAVVLVLWLSAITGLSCIWINEDRSATTLLILCVVAHWAIGARVSRSWQLLSRGVNTWLMWVTYSDLLGANGPHGVPVTSTALAVAIQWAVCVATIVVSRRKDAIETLLTAVTIAQAVCLLNPINGSSFVDMECTPRVLKTVCFCIMFSLSYLCPPVRQRRESAHYQLTALSCSWILLTTPTALPAIFIHAAVILQRAVPAFECWIDNYNQKTDHASCDTLLPVDTDLEDGSQPSAQITGETRRGMFVTEDDETNKPDVSDAALALLQKPNGHFLGRNQSARFANPPDVARLQQMASHKQRVN